MSLNQKLPGYLLGKYQLIGTVTFSVLFALVFLLIYIPFSDTAWFGLGGSGTFFPTILFAFGTITFLSVSRRLMYRSKRLFEMPFWMYIAWCTIEIFSIVLPLLSQASGDKISLAIVKILSDNPNKIFTLSYFTEKFNSAKSTISEDLIVVKNVFEKLELGQVITISGAAGGVKYIPKTSKTENEEFLLDLCKQIEDPSRVLSGGFLYLIDLIYNPRIASKIGKIFASNIDYSEADYVVTMETKGIPMALMTAKAMNLPLVIIRKDTKVSCN